MKQRGRKSAAELEVAERGLVQREERPDAPYDLTDEQSEEWWAVVNRMPADHFPRETHGMLAQYCRHVVTARRVAQLIAGAEADADTEIETLDRLYKMQEREGRALSSLANRMRLSQSSTSDRRKKPAGGTRKPWQGN